MRKLQFNPDLDSTLSDLDRPRMDITDPVYNCKNPVTVIQTNQTFFRLSIRTGGFNSRAGEHQCLADRIKTQST